MSKFDVRIYMKSLDFLILNKLSFNLIKFLRDLNIYFKGPVYLPTKRKFFNILRSPHVNKDSRDQLEIFFYKRFIDFICTDKSILISIKNLYIYYNLDFNFIFL